MSTFYLEVKIFAKPKYSRHFWDCLFFLQELALGFLRRLVLRYFFYNSRNISIMSSFVRFILYLASVSVFWAVTVRTIVVKISLEMYKNRH